MQKLDSRVFWYASLGGAALLLSVGWHTIYAYSVDIGLHYALANQLFAQLSTDGLNPAYLGVMTRYPTGAHWLAVIVSLVTRSPLISFVVLTEVATYATYVTIALFLIDRFFIITATRLTLMFAAVWLLAKQQAAFGYQVIVNYFFPQLVGESLVLIALYALSVDRLWSIDKRYLGFALVAFTWILAYIQPIAAVQFAGSLVVYVLISLIINLRTLKASWRSQLVWPAVLSAVLMLAVIVHPAFQQMTAISANNGYLKFGTKLSIGGYMPLVLVAIASASLALYGTLTGKLSGRRPVVLASATLASSALLLGQRAALFFFALGSDYAVSKHVFFLATIAATTGIYAGVGLLLARQSSLPLQAKRIVAISMVPAAFALCATYIVATTAKIWRQDLRPLLEYQAFANHFRQFSLPVDGDGNIVSLNKSFSPTMNFLVSFGDLKLPLDLAQRSINSYRLLVDVPVKYALVSSKQSETTGLQQCAAGARPSSEYSGVDRECYLKSQVSITPNVAVKTASGEIGAVYLTEGWAAPEPWGVWSLADIARIEFSIGDKSASARYELHVKYIAFIAGSRQQQSFTVIADGVVSNRYVATDAAAKEFIVPIKGDGHHVVELKIDNPLSPQDLGLSEADARKLGIGVTEMSLRVVSS
jgi:hypothetical protein